MRLLKKIRSRSGETLIESVVSIMVLTLAMMFLAAGLSSAGKVASLIDLEGASFSVARTFDKEAAVTLASPDGSTKVEYQMRGYMTANEYYYYD